ncbi:carotenoid oxygenase family protein [soil metagenome]
MNRVLDVRPSARSAIVFPRTSSGINSVSLRYVDTPARREEQRAQRRFYGGYGTHLGRPLRELFLNRAKNPANTGVLTWQGRVFALCEAGLPEALDASLGTIGPDALGGVVSRAFTAHPKRIPSRRMTIGTGLELGGRPNVEIYALPDEGAARRLCAFDAPNVYLLHDFAVTKRHAVFVAASFAIVFPSLLLRRKGFVTALSPHPSASANVFVVPLDAPHDVMRIPIDPCYVEHLSNAFEQDGEIFVDATRYESLSSLQEHVGDWLAAAPRALRSKLVRLRIDLARRRAHLEAAPPPEGSELPRFDPAIATDRHRHLFTVGWRRPEENGRVMWNAILRHDRETGDVDTYAPGDHCVVSEPMITRVSDRDDGLLVLVVVHDVAKQRSRIEVLDARAIANGPIAYAEARELWPFRLHGEFTVRS